MRAHRAPRLASWLVARCAPADRRDELAGDLNEAHGLRLSAMGRGRAWLLTWIDALDVSRGLLAERLGDMIAGGIGSGSEARLAFRVSLRSPVMTLTSVFTLAVGVTLATTGYTVVDAILHPELPFENGDRWVEIRVIDAETKAPRPFEADLLSILRTASQLAHVGAVRALPLNVEYGTGMVELVAGGMITPGTFAHLPFVPLAGRAFALADTDGDAESQVMIGESLWERRFGRDAGVIGTTLSVAGRPRTIIGVLPEDAEYPIRGDVWLAMPYRAFAGVTTPLVDVSLLGVMADGTTTEIAARQLTALAQNRVPQRFDGAPLEVDVRRVGEVRGAAAPGGLLIASLLGLVIVVAGNVANLVIARTAARRSELAVRTALGAARSRLVGQLTLEVLIVGIVAAALGLMASQYILRQLVLSEAEDIPFWMDLSVNARVFVFVVAIALLVTIVAGILPALRATRGDTGQALRGRSGAAPMFGRFDDAMIVAQVALSIGILGAATMIHKGWMSGYGGRDVDVPSAEVLLATISLTGAQDGDAAFHPDSLAVLRDRIETVLVDVPGVVGAGTSDHMPGSDAPQHAFLVEGDDGSTFAMTFPTAQVGPGFFASLDVSARSGRLFLTEDYDANSPPVAMVNQPFVDRVLGGANAIGRRVRLAGRSDAAPVWHEIVGVVPDLGLSGADPALAAGIYLPLRGKREYRLLLRVEGPPLTLEPQVRRALFDVSPDITVSDVRVLAVELRLLRRVYLFLGSVFTSVGAIVLLLSLTALYAILSFEVTRRTREIGVRVALGATRRTILFTTLRRMLVMVGLASLIGTVLGLGLVSGARAALVMRFPPTGPLTFVILTAAACVAALAAVSLPALRAMRIVPMDALRTD